VDRRTCEAQPVASGVTRVKADADRRREARRPAMLNEHPLDLNRTGDGIGGAIEGDQKAIAGMIDLTTVVTVEQPPKGRVMPAPEITPSRVADETHERRRAHDVAEEEGAADARTDHRRRRRCHRPRIFGCGLDQVLDVLAGSIPPAAQESAE
jgi:hypothetical protein